jgi:hypothetical protein
MQNIATAIGTNPEEMQNTHQEALQVFFSERLEATCTNRTHLDKIFKFYKLWLENSPRWASLSKTRLNGKVLREQLRIYLPHVKPELITRKTAPVVLKRVVTIPSLQKLIVKRLVRDVEKEEEPGENPQVQGWLSAWASEEIRWLPCDLRSWLLDEGVKMGPPGLLRRTYHVYVERLEKKLLQLEEQGSPKELTGQKKKRKGKKVDNCGNKKKQKQNKKDMGTRKRKNIKEKDMKESLVKEADPSKLLERMKDFLSGAGKNINFLKKLPVELRKDGSVINQLTEYWLPTIIQYFGSLERFTYYFWKTEEGKEAISELMSSDDPQVERLLNNNIDTFVQPKIKEWRDKVQQVYDSHSVEVLKGLFQSESTYQQQRELLLMENTQRKEFGLRRKPSSSKLPRYLKDAPDLHFLCLAVEQAVRKKGGGFLVGSWNGPNFISKVEEEYKSLKTSGQFRADLAFHSTTGRDIVRSAVKDSRQRYIGSWFISMYLRTSKGREYQRRLEFLWDNRTTLEKIATGPYQFKMEQWTDFLNSAPQELWQGVDPFVAFKWFRSKVSPLARRTLRFIDDIPICGAPALSSVKRELKSLAIGQWKLDKRDSEQGGEKDIFEYNGLVPLPQLVDKLREGYYPIGRILKTKAADRGVASEGPYLGRYVDLRIVMAYLLSLALNNNLLKKPRGMKQKLDFGLWVDGTNVGGHPVLAILAFFIWRTEYSTTSESKWTNALRFCPVSLVVLPESQTNISDMVACVREQALQLQPLVYKGIRYKFQFRVLSGDHSAQQKIMGNVGGSGWSRCEQCDVKFNDFEQLWHYDKLHACSPKSLSNVVEQWLAGKAGESGLTNISPLLGKDVADLQSLDPTTQKWIRKFLVALDSLHNTKGHLATIVKRLQKGPGWNDALFKNLLEKHVQRRNVAELDGQHYRLLFAEWRKVLLPALESTEFARLEKLKLLFHHWEEIQWIMHLPPEARGNKGLRLRLHVLTFNHLQLCRELFPDQIIRTNTNNAKLRWATLVTLTPSQIQTLDIATLTVKEISELIRKVYSCKVVPRVTKRGRSKPVSLYKYATKYGKIWSKLRKEQLCHLLADLCQLPDLPNSMAQPAAPIPVSSSQEPETRVKRKSVMNLYLHAIVGHLADFYESLDFKNSSTERGEAFLASMKHIVLRFTGRDFTEPQTMREVLIRHCWQARVVPKLRSTIKYQTTSSRISRAFDGHVFHELKFDFSTNSQLKQEVLALVKHLQDDFCYESDKYWKFDDQSITFNTVHDIQQTFHNFHKQRTAGTPSQSTAQ